MSTTAQDAPVVPEVNVANLLASAASLTTLAAFMTNAAELLKTLQGENATQKTALETAALMATKKDSDYAELLRQKGVVDNDLSKAKETILALEARIEAGMKGLKPEPSVEAPAS